MASGEKDGNDEKRKRGVRKRVCQNEPKMELGEKLEGFPEENKWYQENQMIHKCVEKAKWRPRQKKRGGRDKKCIQNIEHDFNTERQKTFKKRGGWSCRNHHQCSRKKTDGN